MGGVKSPSMGISNWVSIVREALLKKKNVFFRALPKLPLPPPPPPNLGNLYHFILDVKNDVLARITEQSKNDYDNDVGDNCDNNFVTFDDFGVKNDQKVSHNMILMSKYMGQYGGKKGQQIWAGVSPPLFGQCPKENIFRCASIS